jgi:probable HAF family extracellular repeat protein
VVRYQAINVTNGMPNPYALSLNQSDQVVGAYLEENRNRGFIEMGPGKGTFYVHLQGDPSSIISSINNHGVAVGSWREPVGWVYHAFIWEQGQITELSPLIGASSSIAADINDRGEIVGTANFGPSGGFTQGHAFLYDRGTGGVTDLGVLPGLNYSTATAINELGQVVGASADLNSIPFVMRPFLYTDGSLNELTGQQGWAYDINEVGHVVGAERTGFTSGVQNNPFIWRDGNIEPIPFNATPHAINNADLVVGDIMPEDWQQYGFLYRNGQVTDLNALTARLFRPDARIDAAMDVNDDGHILVWVLWRYYGFAVLLEPETVTVKVKDILNLMVTILFGVIQDGGGLVLVGKTPVPIDPWNALTARQWEFVFDRTSALLVAVIKEPEALEQAQRDLREAVDEQISHLP